MSAHKLQLYVLTTQSGEEVSLPPGTPDTLAAVTEAAIQEAKDMNLTPNECLVIYKAIKVIKVAQIVVDTEDIDGGE